MVLGEDRLRQLGYAEQQIAKLRQYERETGRQVDVSGSSVRVSGGVDPGTAIGAAGLRVVGGMASGFQLQDAGFSKTALTKGVYGPLESAIRNEQGQIIGFLPGTSYGGAPMIGSAPQGIVGTETTYLSPQAGQGVSEGLTAAERAEVQRIDKFFAEREASRQATWSAAYKWKAERAKKAFGEPTLSRAPLNVSAQGYSSFSRRMSGVAQPVSRGPSPVDVARQAADSAFQQQKTAEQDRDAFVSNAETVAKDLPALQAKIDAAKFFPVYQAQLVKQYNQKVDAITQQYASAKELDDRAKSFYSQGQSQVRVLEEHGVQVSSPGTPGGVSVQDVSYVSAATRERMQRSGEPAFATAPEIGNYVLPKESRRDYLAPDVRASYVPPAGYQTPGRLMQAFPVVPYAGVAVGQAFGAGTEMAKASVGGQAIKPYVKGFLETPFVAESFEKASGGFEFAGVEFPGAKDIESEIWRVGETYGEAVFGLSQNIGDISFGETSVRELAQVGFSKERRVTTKEQFGAAGGFGLEIGSYFVPPVAVERAVIGGLSSDNPKDFAVYAGTGLAIGGLFKFVGVSSGLLQAKLGSVGATGAAEYYGVAAKAISSYGVPVVMGAGLAAASLPALSSIAIGDKELARLYTRELSSSFGAMSFGAMVGTAGMGRLTSPMVEETFVTAGVTRLTTEPEFKEFGFTKQSARELGEWVFHRTKGKMPAVGEEPDWGNIALTVGKGKEKAGMLSDYPKVLEAIRLTNLQAGAKGGRPYGSSTAFSLEGMKASKPFGDIDYELLNIFYGQKAFAKDFSANWEAVGLNPKELKIKISKGVLGIKFVVGGGKAIGIRGTKLSGGTLKEIKDVAAKHKPVSVGAFERADFAEIAKMTTGAGGYIGGSGGIKLQLKGFRQPRDIEIQFSKALKNFDLGSFAKQVESVFAKSGKKVKTEIGKGKAKIVDERGITQADIILRPAGEKTVMVGGIRVRLLENLVSDKIGALRYTKPGAKGGLAKIAKSTADLKSIAKELGLSQQAYSKGTPGAKANLYSVHPPEMLAADVKQVSSMTEVWPWSHFVESKGGYKIFKASTQWRRQFAALRAKDVTHLLEEYKQAKPIIEKAPGSLKKFFSDVGGTIRSPKQLKTKFELGISGAYYGFKAENVKTTFYPLSAKTGKALPLLETKLVEKSVGGYLQPKAPKQYFGKGYSKVSGYGYIPSGYKAAGYAEYKPSDYTPYKPEKYAPSDYVPYKPSGYKPSKYVPYKPSSYKPSKYDLYKPTGYNPSPYVPYKPTKYGYGGYDYNPYTPYEPKNPKKLLFFPPIKGFLQKKELGFAGFNVFSRKRGKEIRLNVGSLSKESAVGLGAKFARGTAARSFWILPSGSPGASVPGLRGWFKQSEFRRPKGKTRLPRESFVEKSRYALNLPGEYREITLKGLQTKKYNRLLGRKSKRGRR